MFHHKILSDLNSAFTVTCTHVFSYRFCWHLDEYLAPLKCWCLVEMPSSPSLHMRTVHWRGDIAQRPSVCLGAAKYAGGGSTDVSDVVGVEKLSWPLPPILHCTYAEPVQWKVRGGPDHLLCRDDCWYVVWERRKVLSQHRTAASGLFPIGHTSKKGKHLYLTLKLSLQILWQKSVNLWNFLPGLVFQNSLHPPIVPPDVKSCLRCIPHILANTNPLSRPTNTYALGTYTLSYMWCLFIGKSNE